jgi:hypothetical protein
LPLISPRSPRTDQPPELTAPGEHDRKDPPVKYATGDMSLFSMFLSRGGNLQDLALPDFLDIHDINPVLAEVFQALPFVPFKPRIFMLYDDFAMRIVH